jgi:cysteine synthase A
LAPGILVNDTVTRAIAIAAAVPGAVRLDQLANAANSRTHRETTRFGTLAAAKSTAFVSAVCTGSTITDVGKLLKSRKLDVRVVAVDPAGAAVLSGRAASDSGDRPTPIP